MFCMGWFPQKKPPTSPTIFHEMWGQMLYFGDLLGAFLVNHPRWEFAIFVFFPTPAPSTHASLPPCIPRMSQNGRSAGPNSGGEWKTSWTREWPVPQRVGGGLVDDGHEFQDITSFPLET